MARLTGAIQAVQSCDVEEIHKSRLPFHRVMWKLEPKVWIVLPVIVLWIV